MTLSIFLTVPIYSLHTEQNLETVYADKGYFGKPNRDFLKLNHIADGIMRKDSTTAKFTPLNTPTQSSSG
jgi:IS5 family transposase